MASFTAPSTSSSHVLVFRLVVSDGNTTAEDTVTVNVAAYSSPPPPPPTNVPAEPSNVSISEGYDSHLDFYSSNISWNAVTGATYYRVTWRHNIFNTLHSYNTTSLSANLPLTGQGNAEFIGVRACNADGCSGLAG